MVKIDETKYKETMATILIACKTPGKADEVRRVMGQEHSYLHIRRLDKFVEFLERPTEKVHVIIILASITYWKSSNTTKVLKVLKGCRLLGISIACSRHETFLQEVAGKGLSSVIREDPRELFQALERILAIRTREQSIH